MRARTAKPSVESGRWRRRLVAGAAVAVVCLLAVPAWRELRRSDEDRVRAAAEELLAALNGQSLLPAAHPR
jgi:heme A synthase